VVNIIWLKEFEVCTSQIMEQVVERILGDRLSCLPLVSVSDIFAEYPWYAQYIDMVFDRSLQENPEVVLEYFLETNEGRLWTDDRLFMLMRALPTHILFEVTTGLLTERHAEIFQYEAARRGISDGLSETALALAWMYGISWDGEKQNKFLSVLPWDTELLCRGVGDVYVEMYGQELGVNIWISRMLDALGYFCSRYLDVGRNE